MKFLPLLLLAVSLSASGNIISQHEQKIPLYLIRLRTKLTTTTLHEKCPHLIEHDKFVEKRDIDTYDGFLKEQNYAIEMQVYNHVQALLKQCYDQLKSTRPRPTTLPTTTTTLTTTKTTPTTTSILLPPQCTSSATLNLTESWRNNYSETDLKNSDAKILLPGLTWFRFTGAAGNLLKNSCPPSGYSCGSAGGYWSDSPLPTQIGETVNITFHEKLGIRSCDDNNGAQRGRATRCSADRGGVVYIMDVAVDSENDVVCGMD
mgnify:CR=1 FL=1